MQHEFKSNWRNRFKRLGPNLRDDGVIIVGNRITRWIKEIWGKDTLILLPSKSYFSRLVVLEVHNSNHDGVDTTVAKVRNDYWIPRLPRLAQEIRKSCYRCRLEDKKLCEQQMGQLPIERLKPSPPFYYTGVDLFGPIMIKDTVKKRTKMKCYGVIFNCFTTRAIYIDIACGYDTDNFLLVLRRFISIRGCPDQIRSDAGSQIIAASKEWKALFENLDIERINNFVSKYGMTWIVNKSGDAPWQNGCSESLIRLTKRNIASAIGTNVLTINELQTSLFEIASLLNERPIGMRAGDPTESYICPNDLLMGRASKDAPIGEFNVNLKLLKRLAICQEIVQRFWKVWQQRYFYTLIIRQQWYTEVRNLKEGDIVIVRNANQIRGKWQMAMVIDAQPGKDGRVRDVTVKYKNNNSGRTYDGSVDVTIKRSVHNLVLILPIEEQ